VSEFLGIVEPGNQRLLQKSWRQTEKGTHTSPWLQWRSRRHPAELDNSHGYKLYVSPQPDGLPDAFRAVVEVLEGAPAHHFKIGADPIGLLRPDKFVVYFQEFGPLQKASREIAAKLSGCGAQGVPFTAGLTDDGLLSWGIDPRPEKGDLRWQGAQSWRLWVTNRLATALALARNACPDTLQPWQFALERMRLENVDTATWIPTQAHAPTAQ
jgi:hypothetical protein